MDGLHNADVASGECALAQAASEGTTVRMMQGRSPHDNANFLAKKFTF